MGYKRLLLQCIVKVPCKLLLCNFSIDTIHFLCHSLQRSSAEIILIYKYTIHSHLLNIFFSILLREVLVIFLRLVKLLVWSFFFLFLSFLTFLSLFWLWVLVLAIISSSCWVSSLERSWAGLLVEGMASSRGRPLSSRGMIGPWNGH